MPPKVGKKVGIQFYENVLSKINLPLQVKLEKNVYAKSSDELISSMFKFKDRFFILINSVLPKM